MKFCHLPEFLMLLDLVLDYLLNLVVVNVVNECQLHLVVVNECQQLVCTHTLPFIPTLDVYIANTEQRLVTMSASLHTQTGLPNLTIQV